ncbi:YIP1 family protein [uncultured Mailhella sp.]|uniref:YIP1 family protein n=1 Tax=uncultured Mailhella sp. TaxID=1981031 RepID=UPI00262BFF73|nr:YIP1 family protein [uncultured Mailhella sp.]
MTIQCPSCGFEREVSEAAIRPGKKYKVTCPRCSAVFHFALPEAETPLPGTPSPAKPSEQPATPQPAEKNETAEQPEKKVSAVPHLPTEQAGDDPLPPGATIPIFPTVDEPPAEKPEGGASAKKEEEKPRSLWERWQRMREHVREYDARQEQDNGQPGKSSAEGRPQGAPWESPEYYGFWGSFSRTLLGVLFHAPDFFRNVRCELSPIRPILFYVFLSLFQMLASRLWSLKMLNELTRTTSDPQTLAMAENLMKSMNLPLMLLVTPFFSIFQAVILAGLYHLMIRMVQPDRSDFSTTLRVICYSSAPLVLCIVPMFGSTIAALWFVAATFIGCKFALRLSWGRTLLALLPLYILMLAFVSQIPALMNAGA